jgi:hypothetical protein
MKSNAVPLRRPNRPPTHAPVAALGPAMSPAVTNPVTRQTLTNRSVWSGRLRDVLVAEYVESPIRRSLIDAWSWDPSTVEVR